MKTNAKTSIRARAKRALQAARDLKKSEADWVQAHNALYGIGGKFGQLFPTQSDRTAFLKTPEAAEVAAILESLPVPAAVPAAVKARDEVNGKILVRVPRTIHASLLAEAEAEGISLNQLILSKLCVQLRAAV
ncbi:MAG: toxin-antitoxin system HicB family antitoxin [Pirellulales bacterium]